MCPTPTAMRALAKAGSAMTRSPASEKKPSTTRKSCGSERHGSPGAQGRCGSGDHLLAAKQTEDQRETLAPTKMRRSWR